MSDNSQHIPLKPMLPAFDSVPPPVFFPGLHLNASIAGPRNFSVFRKANHQDQVIFHPDLIPNSPSPGPVFGVSQENFCPSLKEDSADIDALLSTDYEEVVESEDDVVSTARTSASATKECSSPDSCSNYESVSKKRLRFRNSSASRGGQKRRHQKLKKMVKTLKSIVPGAEQMTTAGILDEAVHYLKFLRAQVRDMEATNPKA